jgi:hypothetical protein
MNVNKSSNVKTVVFGPGALNSKEQVINVAYKFDSRKQHMMCQDNNNNNAYANSIRKTIITGLSCDMSLSGFTNKAKFSNIDGQTFSEKIKDGDRYKHKHGDEMQFLDIFNETEIDGLLLQIENVRPLSFNSIKELHEIQN